MTNADTPSFDSKSRSSYDFFTTESLRIADLDQNGHVNNITFLELFENVRNRFIQDRTPLIRNDERTYMLVHLDIDYASELRYPGTVDAACRLTEVRRSSVVFTQAIFDGARLAASGHAAIVNVDRLIGKAAPFDDIVRAKLASLLPLQAT